MKINSIAILQSCLDQKKMFSNGNVKITHTKNTDPQSVASKVSSVFFQKTLQEKPEDAIFDGTIPLVYVMPAEPTEVTIARDKELMELITTELARASADLRWAYEDALSQLPSSVVSKDWGFSIDHRGSIVVLDGSQSLSKNEKELIKNALTKAFVGDCAEKVADVVIKALELDRMPAGVSSRMGKYDVTRNNFQDIVDLREYLEAYRWKEKHLATPFDYEGLYSSGAYAMMGQISAKAEAKYAYKNPMLR